MKKRVKKKVEKKVSKKKKRIIMGVMFLVLLLILFFGTNIYLYIKYLIGNDILIRLNVDQENLFLVHGQTQEVNAKVSVLGNLFCEIKCEYYLEDVSQGTMGEISNFSSNSGSTFSKEYEFSSPEIGTGQELYILDIKCRGVKTYLCHTQDKETHKSVLLTVNYDLNETEKQTKENLIQEFYNILNETNSIQENISLLPEKLILTKEKLILEDFSLSSINSINEELNLSIQNFSSIWAEGNITRISEELSRLNLSLDNLKNNTEKIDEALNGLINEYNKLIIEISSIEGELVNYSDKQFTENTSLELSQKILEFNSLRDFIIENKSLSDINNSFNLFSEDYTTKKLIFDNELNSNIERTFLVTEKVNNLTVNSITQLTNISFTPINVILEEPKSQCCYKGNCSACSQSNKSYPLIFIHGHDFSATVSAEYSLDTFVELQQALENDSYINAGSLVVSPLDNSSKGIWGRNPNPISVKATYYLEIVDDKTKLNVFQTKQDNVDTYAVRLNDIINEVKYKTGQDKVVLVSHSMGGLVIRRYMQIFGEESLAQVNLITAPNHGIYGNTLSSCKFFGEQKECNDMDSTSLLINKLNTQQKPNIEVNNIIGLGCDTNGANGDGIVTNKSAYLEWANNFYINGTCGGVEYLHTKILSIEEHPEVYTLLSRILKNETLS